MEITLHKYINKTWFPTDEEPLNLKSNSKSKALVVGQVQSGKTRFMIGQTEKALKGDFDAVIILGGTNNELLKQTTDRFKNEFGRDFNLIETKDTVYSSVPNGKSLILSLKGKRSLEKLEEILFNSIDKKILLFDDESDFGGINISGEEESRSALNKLLNKIFGYIDTGLFISVTATPYADLLSSDSDGFDYAYVLTPPKEYTGIEFFSKHCKNTYVLMNIQKSSKQIDNDELMKIILDHVFRIIDSKLSKSQMLMNSSLGKTFHKRDYSNVKKVIDLIKSSPLNIIFPDKNIEEVIKILNELKKNIRILNSDKDDDLKYDKNSHSVIIGGSIVSRGVTFDYLLTTLILNEPKEKQSADTLLQRARWFGYRGSIYKYMKIYTTRDIFNSLEECKELTIETNNLIKKKGISEARKYVKNRKFDYINATGKNV